MKIYGFEFSNYVRVARATAAHLGIEVEHISVMPGARKQDAPEFRAASPSGRIPALVDGDFMLNESQAIACYLCSKKPGPLYPEDPQQRALVDQWMSFALAHWGRGWQPLQFEQLVKKMFGMGEPDTALVTAGLDFFHRHAYLINKHMNDRLWLVGDEPTLADFCVGAGLINHALIPLPVDDYPAMMSWYARVDALPAWAATAPKG